MCDVCRLGSHRSHHHDYVVNLAAAERAKLKTMRQKCRELIASHQGQIDSLHASSKKCAQSAHELTQAITREFDRIRSAASQRERQLIAEVQRVQQVRRVRFPFVCCCDYIANPGDC